MTVTLSLLDFVVSDRIGITVTYETLSVKSLAFLVTRQL